MCALRKAGNPKQLPWRPNTITFLWHIDPNNSAQRARLLEIKESLKVIKDERADGIKIWSKENWLEFGEKPTKYFFQLENKKQTFKNSISALRVGSVTVQTDKEILASAMDFYKSLYTEEPVDETSQDWLLSQLDKILAFKDQAKCEGELTLSVMTPSVQSGKSSGPDGLPAEFYLYFWGLLGCDVVDILNYGYHRGAFSESQRRAILHLLFKREDPQLLKNRRPISLLNVDYKIATKCLAGRLREVLPLVLSEDHTCGVPDRRIFENLSYQGRD